MIPRFIEKTHITRALDELDRGRQIPRRRKSRKFYLAHGKYPPKYVISLANSVATGGTELPHDTFGGGAETNNFLIARGFPILDAKGNPISIEPVDEDEESAFPEGRQLYRLHRKRERDPKIVKRAKARRLQQTSNLKCDVCGFSFEETYGPHGSGYIEAHHCVPVSELKGKRKTSLSEIALVCSNCHRMLHRMRPWLTMQRLREILTTVTVQETLGNEMAAQQASGADR